MASGGQKAPAVEADKGPDNNKRLALLETSVSALALALAGAGIELKPDQEDPIAQAIAIVEAWRAQMLGLAELKVALAAAKGVDPEAIDDPIADAIEGVQSASARWKMLDQIGAHLAEHYPAIVEAGGTLPEMVIDALASSAPSVPSESEQAKADGERIAELEKQVGELAGQLAEAVAVPAKGRVKEKSVRARKCGPIKADAAAVAAAITEGASLLEIVLSDGAQEIVDFAPYEVRGSNFSKHSMGYLLNVPLFARGASAARTIRGFGLFKDGKQIAFCPHPDVGIAPESERKFTKAVFF